MNMSIGPFNLIFLAIVSAVVYIAGFYCVFKNKLGPVGILTVLLFPLVGSLVILLYFLTRKESSIKK